MKDRLGEISTLNQSSLNAVKHLKESINWDQNRKQRPFFYPEQALWEGKNTDERSRLPRERENRAGQPRNTFCCCETFRSLQVLHQKTSIVLI